MMGIKALATGDGTKVTKKAVHPSSKRARVMKAEKDRRVAQRVVQKGAVECITMESGERFR